MIANLNTPFSEEVLQALADKQAGGAPGFVQTRQDWLEEIAGLIDDGKVTVTLSKIYPLAQAAEAHRESETWPVRGKLVAPYMNATAMTAQFEHTPVQGYPLCIVTPLLKIPTPLFRADYNFLLL